MASESPESKKDHRNSKSITYPPEWEDKDRMSYLLAPFPPSDKPLGLDDPKLAFWSTFILSSSKELRKFVVSERGLQERFRWRGQTNAGCLSVVLESMEKTGQVTKLADFYTVEQSWLSWGASMVKKPVTWALKSYLQASKYEGEYVINCVAKECAETVLNQHQSSVLYSSTDNVMRKEHFEQLCLGSVSQQEAPVLAQQLTRSGHLAKAGTEFGYEVVKLSPSNRTNVTDVDVGIVRIKETVVNLSAQIKMLEEAIARFKQSARDKMKEKDKKGALRALRHSRAKKGLLNSKEAMLDNVQDILHKIQGAETDAMVFAAYKSGVEALGFLRKSQGLTLEAAEDVRADMNQLVEEGEDIAAVLGEGQAGDVDDDELLRELEGLMEPELELDQLEQHMAKLSVKEEGEGSDPLEHLPPVPTGPIDTIPVAIGVTGTPLVSAGAMTTSSTANRTKRPLLA